MLERTTNDLTLDTRKFPTEAGSPSLVHLVVERAGVAQISEIDALVQSFRSLPGNKVLDSSVDALRPGWTPSTTEPDGPQDSGSGPVDLDVLL